MSDLLDDTLDNMFADFGVPDETTLVSIVTRTRKKTKRSSVPKTNEPNINEDDEKLQFARRIQTTDFRIPQITEEVREVIYSYYRNRENVLYEQKHKESVVVAETLIEKHIETLQEHLDICTKIRPTCTQKGWNINLSNPPKSYVLIITCLFQPNYVRKYTITKITGGTFTTVTSVEIPCEKTVV